MAQDANVRLFIEKGGVWVPAEPGDFIGIKLSGSQTADGEKTFNDNVNFEATIYVGSAGGIGGISSFSSLGSQLRLIGSQPSIDFIEASSPTSANGKVSFGPSSIPANSATVSFPSLSDYTSHYVVLSNTSSGTQMIYDKLVINGGLETAGITVGTNARFGVCTFTFDSSSLSNFANAVSSKVATFDNANTFGEVCTFNDVVNFNDAANFSSVDFGGYTHFTTTSFTFGSASLDAFAGATKNRIVNTVDSQLIGGNKVFSSNVTVNGLMSANGGFGVDGNVSFANAASFTFDSQSLSSFVSALGNSFLDLSTDQNIVGKKNFTDKLFIARTNVPLSTPYKFICEGLSYYTAKITSTNDIECVNLIADSVTAGTIKTNGGMVYENASFIFDSTSMSNFLSATSSDLVNISGAQAISGNKSFSGGVSFDGSVTMNSTVDYNGGNNYYSNVLYSGAEISYVNETFSFDSSSLDSFAASVSGRVVVTNANQTINGEKIFGDTVTMNSGLIVSGSQFSVQNSDFEFINITDFIVDINSKVKIQKALAATVVNLTTTSFMPTDAHHENTVFLSATSDITVHLPSGFAGMRVFLVQEGVGKLVFAPYSGTTIKSSGGKVNSDGQYSKVEVFYKNSGECYLFGDIV